MWEIFEFSRFQVIFAAHLKSYLPSYQFTQEIEVNTRNLIMTHTYYLSNCIYCRTSILWQSLFILRRFIYSLPVAQGTKLTTRRGFIRRKSPHFFINSSYTLDVYRFFIYYMHLTVNWMGCRVWNRRMCIICICINKSRLRQEIQKRPTHIIQQIASSLTALSDMPSLHT
jgi:hypothetical protein